MKFALKGENELGGFALLVRSLREFFTCFVDESSALCASPRAHAHKPAIDDTERSEALECRIDPGIQGDIGRTLIRGRRGSITSKDLADRSPFTTAQVRIMMATVNVLGDKVSDHASHEHVGGE